MAREFLALLLAVVVMSGSAFPQAAQQPHTPPGKSAPPPSSGSVSQKPVAPQPSKVPAVDVWQKQMLTLAQKWGDWLDDSKHMPLAFGVEQQVWYYDGGRVYQQIATYTGDAKWNKYADQILSAYADYIIAGQGGVPGWRIFPRGLWMGYQRTKDPKYAEALDLLGYGNRSTAKPGGGVELRYFRQHGNGTKAIVPGNPLNPQWHPEWLRESAYITDVMVVDELRTGKRHPLLQTAVYDCVVADLNEFMRPESATHLGVGGSGSYVSNFMIGLALESLIEYYEMTAGEGKPDTQIPPIVKTVLDFFWQNCVEQSSGAQYYNSNLTNGGAAALNGERVLYTTSNLNQLVAPAFAWYWNFSHDDTYRTRGDLMFSAGVKGAGTNCKTSITDQNYSFAGKEFSQNYKWSFDYVKWRTGVPEPAPEVAHPAPKAQS